VIHYNINLKMLTHDPDHWSESSSKLPVNSIIKHVQEDNGLVSYVDISVTQ